MRERPKRPQTDAEHRAATEEARINTFIIHAFRDTGDEDYIAARQLYRIGLLGPFLWSAEQAVEKYLKGILLFSRLPTNDVRHDLEKALERAELQIKDVPILVPDAARSFIGYLSEQGVNRYMESQRYTHGNELQLLDGTVWHLRRYCLPRLDDRFQSLRNHPLQEIAWKADVPSRYAIKLGLPGGLLEKVIADPKSEQREALLWKNFFYATRRRRVIKRVRQRMSMRNPTHRMGPEPWILFDRLAKLVYFSKEEKQYFKDLRKEHERSGPDPAADGGKVPTGG